MHITKWSQSEKAIYLNPSIWHFGNGRTMRTIIRSVVAGIVGRWTNRAQRNVRVVKILCMLL